MYEEEAKNKRFLKIFISAVAVLLVLILTVTVAVVFTERSKKVTNPEPDDDHPHNIDDQWLLDKKDWDGKPTKDSAKKLHTPVDLVIISHTVSPMCFTFHDCSRRVQNIQAQHMNNNSPDIGYNFLVGGDGHAYVGRGWDIVNFHMSGSIGICLIGDFTSDEYTETMIESTKRLLELGVSLNKLSLNYRLVAHNQTWATESPGVNVYKVIKTWPHFKAGKITS